MSQKKNIGGVEFIIELEISSQAKIASGTLFEIRDSKGTLLASAGFPKIWNSYRSSSINNLHFFVRNTQDAVFERLAAPSPHMRTAYLFGENGEIFVSNMDSGDTYILIDGANGNISYEKVSINDVVRSFYNSGDYTIKYNDSYFYLEACKNDDSCKKIKIHNGTWPYVFTEHNGSFITITNFGDVLIFRQDAWCRAYRDGHKFRCHPKNNRTDQIVKNPQLIQFYTAVDYKDRTLLGEWPTGVFYEFDGEALEPSSLSPPSFTIGNQVGYEPQSSAIYGGDLYVGYWPKGELFRKDLSTGKWEKVKRFFSHPAGADDDSFIPYYTHSLSGVDPSFFGQRVSSMEISGPYLYVSTSNLRSWHKGIKANFLTTEQINEYGTLYRLKLNGCTTVHLNPGKDKIKLKFVVKNESISIYRDSKQLSSAKNETVITDRYLRVDYKAGIFGPLKGINILKQSYSSVLKEIDAADNVVILKNKNARKRS